MNTKTVAQYELQRHGRDHVTGVWFEHRFDEAIKRWNRLQDNEEQWFGGPRFNEAAFINWLVLIWDKLP